MVVESIFYSEFPINAQMNWEPQNPIFSYSENLIRLKTKGYLDPKFPTTTVRYSYVIHRIFICRHAPYVLCKRQLDSPIWKLRKQVDYQF